MLTVLIEKQDSRLSVDCVTQSIIGLRNEDQKQRQPYDNTNTSSHTTCEVNFNTLVLDEDQNGPLL